jgi:hypothetical protein
MMMAMLVAMAAVYPMGGTVVNAVTGAPVAGVRMTVRTTGEKVVGQVVTGPEGRFRFEGLTAGKYSLEAERNGYVQQQYGQRVLFAMYSSAVVVGEGQETEGLVFRLIPGAAITGVVTDEKNEPVAGLQVMAYRRRGRGEHQKLMPVGRAQTNDLGEYRIHSLMSGAFVVMVTGRPWQGRQATLDASGAPGGYAPAFAPGVPDAARAAWVEVAAGGEGRADVRMRVSKAVRLTGQLKGEAPGGRLWAYLLTPVGGGAMAQVGETVNVYGGRFSMKEVPPGRYELQVLEGGRRIIARQAVEVETDPTEVELEQKLGARVKVVATVRGRKPGQEVMVAMVDEDLQMGERKVLDEKGEAEIGEMPPGRYRVMAGGGVALVGMTSGAARVVGETVEIPASGEVVLKLELDAEAVDVPGRVYKEGKAAAGVTMVLVPKRREATSAAYRFDQSDSDGSFTWTGVAAGEYLMFAFEEGEAWDYMDEGVMRGLMEQGQELVVEQGRREEVRVEVRAIKTRR